ncbi:hypothetical protein [Streptomyces lannensis]|uniref:vWA-MoxR associated conflict system protein n=1 Tax=Streptomyces lannensis TaxID=766498 RepID=UPI0031EB4C1D
MLYGTSVSQARIEAAIRGAAKRAAQDDAVLVVALLGHGITPGQNPTLYLMAGDSHADEIGSAVNVSELLTQAVETPGLPGVIAIVDTCHAGGATPDLRSLDAGVRGGAARLSLLMGVGATQAAYGLAFSRGFVEVLEEGVGGGGEFLYPAAVLDAVRDAVPGQDVRLVEFDGAQFGGRPWLARNARHRIRAGDVVGPIANEELQLALDPLGCSALLQTPVTGVQELERLRLMLCDHSSGSAEELAWALRVVDGVLDGLRTVELLTTSWPGSRPTSERLRRALWSAAGRAAGRLPESSGGELLRDAVEFLRLRVPRVHETPTTPLALFVAALAAEDALDAGERKLAAWAHAVGAEVELSDAFEALRERGSKARLRLVVSLHAAVADEWPEVLEVWLLDRGEVHAHKDFTCMPEQGGVEQRLATVLRWASVQARSLGARLQRVEIAASAALLLRWHPEETDFGERLGVAYDVVLRWSERLCPPDHLWWINERARKKLEAMSSCATGSAPVDWLGEHEAEVNELRKLLGNDTYGRAIAVARRPPRFEQVMEVLLAYAPIVLWPYADSCAPEQFRTALDRFWHLLPAEFCEAYRRSWAQRALSEPDGREQLAKWRTVWHDTEWLDFCDWFEQFTIEEENSV